jgi:RNA polymerase sigma factor (sigma-70 family)
MTLVSNEGLPPISALLSAIQAGGDDAIAAFIKRYEPQLRRVLRVTKLIRLLQSQIDSEDLVQSALNQVIADIQGQRVQFSDMAGLEGYLKKVGRNRLRDQIRRLKAAKRNQQQTVPGDAAGLANLVQSGPSPSRLAELREQVARVEACISPSELEVIKERVEGAGWPELAAARGLNPEALRKRIERIRQRIRQALAESTDSTAQTGQAP